MSELNVGDWVWPSKENPHHFNKNAGFPWKVKKRIGLTLWVEHESKSGKKYVSLWMASFWETFAPIVADKQSKGGS